MLCGILFHHPEIVMHNELFNPIDIFTYYPHAFSGGLSGEDGGDGSRRWTVRNGGDRDCHYRCRGLIL